MLKPAAILINADMFKKDNGLSTQPDDFGNLPDR